MAKSDELTRADERVLDLCESAEAEYGLAMASVLAMHEYDLDDQVNKYFEQNKTPAFMDVYRYVASLCPPVE